MKAFEVKVNGKTLDYRVGKNLDLERVRELFEKTYTVINMQQAGRHVIGHLKKENHQFFVKLATTEGISHVTKNEYEWNDYFNRESPRATSPFWVPQNNASGYFDKNLFYMVTDVFEGRLLAEKPERADTKPIRDVLEPLIAFTEGIQTLPGTFSEGETNAQQFFREKAQAWFDAIPASVKEHYNVGQLLDLVENTYRKLAAKPRHGDFTPWHIYILNDGKLGLIDGEHARGNGVEYYDIAYFMQRVFSVMEDQQLAQDILEKLRKRGYDLAKLQTVLAARAIGGFLDESLKGEPDYTVHDACKDFVLSLQ